jgi:hypothetical protein
MNAARETNNTARRGLGVRTPANATLTGMNKVAAMAKSRRPRQAVAGKAADPQPSLQQAIDCAAVQRAARRLPPVPGSGLRITGLRGWLGPVAHRRLTRFSSKVGLTKGGAT